MSNVVRLPVDFKTPTTVELLRIKLPFAPQRKRSVQVYGSRYGKGHAVDPDAALKKQLSEYIADHVDMPIGCYVGPLKASFLFSFAPPKSYTRKVRENCLKEIYAPTIRLDVDNMQKLYQDVLNFGVLEGKIFADDKQVVVSNTVKIWAPEGSVTIVLEALTKYSDTILYPFI